MFSSDVCGLKVDFEAGRSSSRLSEEQTRASDLIDFIPWLPAVTFTIQCSYHQINPTAQLTATEFLMSLKVRLGGHRLFLSFVSKEKSHFV